MPTVPGHTIIASLLQELGYPVALAAGLRQMAADGRKLHAALEAVGPDRKALAQQILRIGAVTTGAEDRLMGSLGLHQ